MNPNTHKTLIFIPTFNEKENVGEMTSQLLNLELQADILFLDDNSPDGTGEVLDALAERHPQLSVIHRSGKLGIGTAHVAGIRYAYDHGYDTLITMDCDFTHSPSDIKRLMVKFGESFNDFDVVVGSRHLQADSLPGWNLFRRVMTSIGHTLTRRLLGMSYDATGAFRVYRLSAIPRPLFDLVRATGYSFFFESLFLLHFNDFRIGEVPIILPARTYGHSKMSMKEAAKSARQVFGLSFDSRLNPLRFRLPRLTFDVDPTLHDPQDWDTYWNGKQRKSNIVYDFIAGIYRRLFIRPSLRLAISRTFKPGSKLLHAGCGGGQVDRDIHQVMQVTALDISTAALTQYCLNNPGVSNVYHATIFGLRFPERSFDGIYNLGVMEHFTDAELGNILIEFHRVLATDGKLLLFWPHRHAPSVHVLNAAHWLANRLMKRKVRFHPPEVSLLQSRGQIDQLLTRANFKLVDYKLGFRDLYIQAVIVANKIELDHLGVRAE